MVLHEENWERCLFCAWVERDTRCTSCRRRAKPVTRDMFCVHIAVFGGSQERRGAQSSQTCGVLGGMKSCSVQESGRRGFVVKPTAKYVDGMLGPCSITECEASCDAIDRTYTMKQPHANTFNTHCSEPLLANCSTYGSETGSSVSNKETRVTNTCTFDTRQGRR